MNSALSILLNLLPTVIKGVSDNNILNQIVGTILEITPALVKEFNDVAPFVKNIISTLQDHDLITDAQWDALDALSAKVDADFEDAAAKAQAEDNRG